MTAAPPEMSAAETTGVDPSEGIVMNSVPSAAPAIHTKAANRPVRIGGGVSEANLMHRVQPLYPPLARTAHVEGTVEFTATISKEGAIENLQLVRGHPLLVDAARQAILQWRYRPTLLNGEPVEVITDIIVKFTQGQ
jgi:protein TonB